MKSRLRKLLSAGLIVLAELAVRGMASSQTVQRNGTLNIDGRTGNAPVIQINGKSYVDIEALARVANASLTFKGNQITLTMAPAGASPSPVGRPEGQPANSGFSADFLKAGIEEMAVIREWRSALVNAVQNGYPVTDDFAAGFRGRATTGLRLASVAASTDSDRSAFQLLSNELDNIQRLSNKILAARKNMNYISSDALKDDPLDRQILSCARALAAMAANGQFQDDGSCH